MNYVAIDFETAACRMDSACALGLVRFDSEGRAGVLVFPYQATGAAV